VINGLKLSCNQIKRGRPWCEDGHEHAEAGNPEELMQWLIAPMELDRFMAHVWWGALHYPLFAA